MSALAESSRDRLLARIRQNSVLDPFKDLVTGSDESPEEILGFNRQASRRLRQVSANKRSQERYRRHSR
jgi:hypothetical protein